MRLLLLSVLLLPISIVRAAAIAPETVKEWKQDEARIVTNTPANFDAAKPTLLIIYLLPNGSTIEMTAGAKPLPGMDWHYDIQHINAQTRRLREIDPSRNYVVAYVEAQSKTYKLTWPIWRKDHGADGGTIIRKIIDDITKTVLGKDVKLAIVSHSGGGSFMFGYLNGGEKIGDNVERMVWIDSNYGYDEKEQHAEKLVAWLKGDPKRHLIVFAYDDFAALLDGKHFVSETGGTFYHSHEMIKRIEKEMKVERVDRAPFETYAAMNKQIHFMLNTNPEKKILHTVLVERNGLLEAMTYDTLLAGKWGGEFWGERAYMDLVDAHVPNLQGGRAFIEANAQLIPRDSVAAIYGEVQKGNIPDFLRKYVDVSVTGGAHQITYRVIPDYFAIGNDADFVRMPMTPGCARKIADAMGCVLPTRKMVDDIYAQAKIKLDPQPMTESREAMKTYLQNNDLIEKQLAGKPRSELVAGDKKDIVITNRLKEKPNRVAIYGWHKLDGKAIQPLTIVHGDWYADYSHGVRLVKNECIVDGKPTTMARVMKDSELCKLVSDEGPIDVNYPLPATTKPATTTSTTKASKP